MGGDDPTWQRRQQDRGVLPIQDMDVDFVIFDRRDSPWTGRDRPATSSINGLAIPAKPAAHVLQTGDKVRLNLSVGHRPDIEQKIRVQASRPHQVMYDLLGAL